MMDNRFLLHPYGKHLWTRELAKKIRSAATEIVESLMPGEALIFDLNGVEVFDYSFANELFGKIMLALPREYPGRFVVIENLTDYTRENLAKALEGLSLAMIERTKGKLELLGKVHPTDRETFGAIVLSKGPISASELSKKLDVNLTAMNERLAKLTGLGLIHREKTSSAAGREQYQYQVWR